MKKYYCYYSIYRNGELYDDWSEWCNASSYEEAKVEFESRYPHQNVNIDQIIEK